MQWLTGWRQHPCRSQAKAYFLDVRIIGEVAGWAGQGIAADWQYVGMAGNFECQFGCEVLDDDEACSRMGHDHGVHRSVGISQGLPRNLPIFDLMTGIAKASAPADDPGILIAGLKNP